MGRKRSSKTRSLAIASGKGGVGKSCIALNLAAAMARRGERVLLLDGDLGLGNIGLLLGSGGEWTFEDALLGRCAAAAAVLEGPEGLAVLTASSAETADCWPEVEIAASVVEDFERLVAGFDTLVIDTGAGIADKTVDLVVAADEALLVVTPEPTAIADAYAALKALLIRRPDLVAGLVVNMADSADEAAELHAKFAELASRFLGAKIDNRGYIPLDRYVREAVKRQVPFVLTAPPSPAAQALTQLAGYYEKAPVGKGGGPSFFTRALAPRTGGVD